MSGICCCKDITVEISSYTLAFVATVNNPGSLEIRASTFISSTP